MTRGLYHICVAHGMYHKGCYVDAYVDASYSALFMQTQNLIPATAYLSEMLTPSIQSRRNRL